MRERIARSVFWVVWSRGGVQILSWISTLLVARWLHPKDYGLMALVGVCIGTTYLLAEFGLGTAIIQFPEVEDRELNACFWIALSIAGLGYTMLFAAAPAIAAWFSAPGLPVVLRIAGLSLILVTVRIVPESLLRKRLLVDKISQAEIISTALYIPLVVTLAWWGYGVWALVAGGLFTPVVQGVAMFLFARWWPGLRCGSRRIGKLLRYSMAALGSKLTWALYDQADSFVLGKVSGDVALGFYSIAKEMAMLPITKIVVVANQLSFPVMSELQVDKAKMREAFLRLMRLIVCVTAPLCVGGALVAQDLVAALLSDKWLPAAPLLQVLCLAGLVHSFAVLIPPLLLARYRATFLFWWALTLLLVMPFAFWLGGTVKAALGVALAWLVVYPLFVVWLVREALAELQLGFRSIWEHIWPILVAIVMMVVVVLAMQWTIPGSEGTDRLLRLLLIIVAAAMVYGAAVYLRGGLVVREVLEVAKWVLQPRSSLTAAK